MSKDKKILCPLMGCECIEGNTIKNSELIGCRFWVSVQGKHPQTGEIINNEDCSFAWLPVLMIENSKVSRETASAVESFRNEMVKANEVGQRVLLAAAGVPQQAQKMILENDQ
jgi:hypothetical protein